MLPVIIPPNNSKIENIKFNINAIKRSSTKELEYHVAFKKSDYLDEKGNLIKPDKEL